jgi:hypothetical protein
VYCYLSSKNLRGTVPLIPIENNVIVTKRDTPFECDCCWQKEKRRKNKFISPPPFSRKISLSLLPLFAGVLTIGRTLKF